jgi:beta-glucosidase
VFVFAGLRDGVHSPGLRDPALALRASHVVNLAHAEAVAAVRASAPAAAVGSAFNVEAAYPATDDPRDVQAAERHHAIVNAWFLDPLLRGRYPTAFVTRTPRWPRWASAPATWRRWRPGSTSSG